MSDLSVTSLSVIITYSSSPNSTSENYGFAVMSQRMWEDINDDIRKYFAYNTSYTSPCGSLNTFYEWRDTMRRAGVVDPLLASWLQQTFNMSRHPHYTKGVFTYGHFPLPFKSDERD